MVGLGRFELPTSPLSGVRSNQLSYRPGTRIQNILRAGLVALLPTGSVRIQPAPELSRKVSRTQLNMRSDYVALTIVQTRKRKREGLVQAHAGLPKQAGMVLGPALPTQRLVKTGACNRRALK